jgi:hypothetical protein
LRFERLIQAYLQPHRWYFRCQCGKKKNTRHQEYFKISDDVARDVFSFWRRFMLQGPYCSYGASPTLYTLSGQWMVRIHDREPPSETESHEDHELKLGRWRRILRPIGDEVSNSQTAGDANKGIANAMTAPKWSTPKKTDRPQSASPDQKNEPKALNVGASSTGRNEASLAVPGKSPKVSRSVPSSPPRGGLFGTAPIQQPGGLFATAPTQKAASLNKEADVTTSRPMGLEKKDHIVRPASSAGERTLPLSSPQSKLKEGDHTVRPASSAGERPPFKSSRSGSSPQSTLDKVTFPSLPKFNFDFRAPFPNRGSALYQAEDKGCQVDFPSTSSEQKRIIQDQGQIPSKNADSTGLRSQPHVDWTAKYRELEKMMHRRRNGLASRSIWEDVVQFRWPISFAMCLAMCSSYVPGSLAFVTWFLFLPCFVAELRSWFPEVGHGN